MKILQDCPLARFILASGQTYLTDLGRSRRWRGKKQEGETVRPRPDVSPSRLSRTMMMGVVMMVNVMMGARSECRGSR